jgi:aryl-alcohol dehydrogenase-like predicted oxidoreductase
MTLPLMPDQPAPLTDTLTIGADIVVNRLGFGAMRLTGPTMWGDFPDRDRGIALLRRVVEAGVTFIDTADAYGPHTNEVLIHDALHPYPAGLVIATKGGVIRGGPDYADFDAVGNREYLRQSAYLSARRLGVQHIDLYYLHNPNQTDVPFLEQVATLAELREQGVIRNIGLSNISVDQFQAAREVVDIAAVTAQYNIGHRSGAGLLEAAEHAGVAFSPWRPTTVADGSAGQFNAVLDPICKKHRATLPQIALAWLLHRSPVMLPIPGTSSLKHLEENLAAASIHLAAEDVHAISELVPEDSQTHLIDRLGWSGHPRSHTDLGDDRAVHPC